MRMPRGNNKKPSDPSSESAPTPELDEVGIPEPEKAVAKAAAFGAMMGKAAALLKRAEGVLPASPLPSPPTGGPTPPTAGFVNPYKSGLFNKK